MDIEIKLIGLHPNMRLTHAMIRPNSVFYQFCKMSWIFFLTLDYKLFFVLKAILSYVPDHFHFRVNISNFSRIRFHQIKLQIVLHFFRPNRLSQAHEKKLNSYSRDDIKLNFQRLVSVLSKILFYNCGRRCSLMVSTLVSGSSGLGSNPGQGHCVVSLGKTLYSHSASLHPGV